MGKYKECKYKCTLKLGGLTLDFDSIKIGSMSTMIQLCKNKKVIATFFSDVNHLKCIDSSYEIYRDYTLEPISPRVPKNVITFTEASKMWGLSESTLRMAVKRNKLCEDYDYRKSGKVFLTTIETLKKIYGEPNNID